MILQNNFYASRVPYHYFFTIIQKGGGGFHRLHRQAMIATKKL